MFEKNIWVKRAKQGQLANDATSSVYDYYLRHFLSVSVEIREEMRDFLLF